MQTPISPEMPMIATEVAPPAATQLAALSQQITPTGGMMEATKTLGAVASPIASTLVSTGLAIGALFFVAKGVQMVVTGKNSFKKESLS